MKNGKAFPIPVKATYATGTTPTFAADAAVAGQYQVQGTAEGFADVTVDADLSTADQVIDRQFAP